MSAADPKREFAIEVVRTLQNAGYQALWAGGCVRDLLLNRPPDDYDVATSARPDEVQAVFGRRRTLAIGASFGVMLVHGPRRSPAGDVEVATFRTEGPYRDGRRPDNVTFATAEADAHRRDFTINGMFLDPLRDEVFDYVGGRADLERGIVRAIGDPHARFQEDKLRMLRAVRIVARFDFALDPATAVAAQAMAREMLVVSAERIVQELKKMLVHPRRRRAIELAHELGLMTVILPELAPVVENPTAAVGGGDWPATLAMLESLASPRFELAFATLLSGLAPGSPGSAAAELAHTICRRLKLSNDECHAVTWLIEHRSEIGGVRDWPLHRIKRLAAQPLFSELLVLLRQQATARGNRLDEVEFLEQFVAAHPASQINPPPLITGDDLRRLGLSPGPDFRELLETVRNAQLDGTVAEREAALLLVRRLKGLP